MNIPFKKQQLIDWGRKTLEIEGRAVLAQQTNLGATFYEATSVLFQCKGKVIFTGLGKSGYVAQKLAATFSSIGTAAFFLHPSEALHGDFGMLDKKDCLVAIAHGGETREVLAVVNYCKERKIPVVALGAKKNSSLGEQADVFLQYLIQQEADPLGVAPTTSSTVALALGDALATTLMRCRNFNKANFAALHPGGTLGRALARVSGFMRQKESLVWVSLQASFSAVLPSLNQANFGVVGVLNEQQQLLGVISDGDLRRALLIHKEHAFSLKASDIMTQNPKCINREAQALKAVRIMEKHQITSLFVVSDETKSPIGLIRLHDLIIAGLI